MPLSRLACRQLPALEAETLRRLQGSNRTGTAGAEPPTSPHVAVALGAWGWVVDVLAARSQRRIYCRLSIERVREPAKGFGVKGLGSPIAPPPTGMNPTGA